ncbi:MAG: DUF4345 domain-containing protein [Bacteroidetes bacterium]|nr:MAG: DUF4345 domain-containing protein [Bacteroidota bacterium]TAE67155.1 MAG: DUF4345 domain-containing protein [Bacteroidota bacterium]TAF92345.1 MAG: DUF4345 domain-containing protein [Bacteroidota bacterium]
MLHFKKNLHLIVSVVTVMPAAIVYGSPKLLPEYLNINVSNIDTLNMLKAIMCLYIVFSVVWVLGIVSSNCWKFATQLNILFMLSLGIGRVLSTCTDGFSGKLYIFGMIAELAIGGYAWYQLKNKPLNLP